MKQTSGRPPVYLGVGAGFGQVPHFASAVAERTHDDAGVTHLVSAARENTLRL